jgi:hypothetical protein
MRGVGKPDGRVRDAVAEAERTYRRSSIFGTVDRPRSCPPSAQGVVLDLDSSVSPTHGEQEMRV